MRKLLAAILLVLLTSCTFGTEAHPELETNEVDRARTEGMVAAPWPHLTEVHEPGRVKTGPGTIVNRAIGFRQSNIDPANPLPTLQSEVEEAIANGWTVFGVECTVRPESLPEPDQYQDFRIGLQRSPADLDHAAIATISGVMRIPGVASRYSIENAQHYQVWVYLPHHADKGWPDYPSIAPDLPTSCVGSAAAPTHTGSAVPDQDPFNKLGQGLPFDEHPQPITTSATPTMTP